MVEEEFTVVAAAKCAPESDRRLKEDVVLVGRSPAGVPIYTWRYTAEAQRLGLVPSLTVAARFRGTMAQDLLALPQFAGAVLTTPSGFYSVDYSQLDVAMEQLE